MTFLEFLFYQEMNEYQRKRHTHLQFAPATAKAKIAKEYVLPTLTDGRKIKPAVNKELRRSIAKPISVEK